jgi:hypothetical protein
MAKKYARYYSAKTTYLMNGILGNLNSHSSVLTAIYRIGAIHSSNISDHFYRLDLKIDRLVYLIDLSIPRMIWTKCNNGMCLDSYPAKTFLLDILFEWEFLSVHVPFISY